MEVTNKKKYYEIILYMNFILRSLILDRSCKPKVKLINLSIYLHIPNINIAFSDEF